MNKPGAQNARGSVEGVFDLIRTGRAKTRAELAGVTGLTRATISHRVEALIKERLIYEAGEGESARGRPPIVLKFDHDTGVILAADLGATHCRLSVSDLNGVPMAELATDLDIARGPDEVLGWVQNRFMELLSRAGRDKSEVWAIGLGVPGPVDFGRGQVVNPPVMPGWHGVAIGERFQDEFGDTPVLIDNDVNIMAVGEHRVHWRDRDHLLFVKVGTGIGCGIVANGHIQRGAQGSAGDIGHIRIVGHGDAVCRCGNVGCVEAVAGGWALAQQLAGLGFEARNARDVVRLVREGNPVATRYVRRAGEVLGEVLASAVSLLNPDVVVIGGDLAHAREQLFAGIRSVVYERSLPLATRQLEIVPSQLDDRAGIFGAGGMAAEYALALAAAEAEVRAKNRRRAG